MRQAFTILGVLASFLIPSPVTAGGYNRIYLVPAIKECHAASSCPREFESAYTFDSIILMTPAGRYLPKGKPSLILDIRGVRDPSRALLNGSLTLHVISGRVSLAGFGTFPDKSSLTQVAPVPILLRNGRAKNFPYRPAVEVPNGLITNGGGVEVLDPDGNRLAVTGSQSRP